MYNAFSVIVTILIKKSFVNILQIGGVVCVWKKLRSCQLTFILHTKRSAQQFYFDGIILLNHFAYTAKKPQQSLQPDKHHKLNKTGAEALLKPMRNLLFTSVLQALYFESYNVHSFQRIEKKFLLK